MTQSPAQVQAQKTMAAAVAHQTMVHQQTNDPAKHAEETEKVRTAVKAYIETNKMKSK